MTRRAIELEARLAEWASVYGGGRYGLSEGIKSPMGSMMKWGGRPPTGLGQELATPDADEVQDAVRALEQQGRGRLPAQVLRCEYLTPGAPIESKLQRLRKAGENVSRSGYFVQLRRARHFVAAELGIPIEIEGEE